jgi:hypothetical protein
LKKRTKRAKDVEGPEASGEQLGVRLSNSCNGREGRHEHGRRILSALHERAEYAGAAKDEFPCQNRRVSGSHSVSL